MNMTVDDYNSLQKKFRQASRELEQDGNEPLGV